MNYGSNLGSGRRFAGGAQSFALRISGTAAKLLYFHCWRCSWRPTQTHLIRLLKEQKPLKNFSRWTNDIFAKSHGLLFCPIRDKMDPTITEIAILQDECVKSKPHY